MKQPMDLSDFQELVHEAAYSPNLRWVAHGSKSDPRAPKAHCTLLVGAWLPVQKTDEKVPTLHPDHVTAYNVPTPQIPEYTVYGERRIEARGWKGLLEMMLGERVIRPTPRVIKALGDDWEHVRRKANIRCY